MIGNYKEIVQLLKHRVDITLKFRDPGIEKVIPGLKYRDRDYKTNPGIESPEVKWTGIPGL